MKKILTLALFAYIASVVLGYLISVGLSSGTIPSDLFKSAIQDVYLNILIFFIIFSLNIIGFKFFPKITGTLVKYYFILVVFIISLEYSVILSSVAGHAIIGSLLGLGVAILVCAIYYRTWYELFNFWGLFITIFISALVGQEYSLSYMVIWLTFFALYDYAAVFLSKVMKFIVVSFVGMERIPQAFIYEGSLQEIIARLKAKGDGAPAKKNAKKPSNSNLLGLGDLLIPSCFAVSVIHVSPILAVAVAFFGFLGLLLNFNILIKHRIGLPAIPLIFAPQVAVVGIYFGLLQNNLLYLIAGLVIVPVIYLTISLTAQIAKKRALDASQLL